MPLVLPKSLDRLLPIQGHVVTHAQAVERGKAKSEIKRLVRSGNWQRLHRGVYYVYNTPVPRLAQLWGAVLRIGHNAVLSHETAAEVWKLTDQESAVIHVSVPRKTGPVPAAEGVTVHYSARLPRGAFPLAGYEMPPVTAVDEVIFDLADAAATAEAAVNWAIKACQMGATSPDVFGMYLLEPGHRNLRWRAELQDALTDVRDGVQSPLERRYLYDVERAHRLPKGRRQVRTRHGTTVRYHDVRYVQYGVGVELDGVKFHRGAARDLDDARDNTSALDGVLTLRYGWIRVAYHPCEVAHEVWTLLAKQGYRDPLERCGPACRLMRPSGGARR